MAPIRFAFGLTSTNQSEFDYVFAQHVEDVIARADALADRELLPVVLHLSGRC